VNQSAIGWIALAIAVFVYLDLLFVELRRIGREGGRIVQRLLAYAELPVIAQAERAADDVERLTIALEAVGPLLDRGRVALEAIRHPREARRERYDLPVPNGSEASKGFSPD
jgi:hypothetical protein